MLVREVVTPSGLFFRVAWASDPWDWPPPIAALSATGEVIGTGSRYDDPLGEFSVLYAARQRRGCFLETLDRYRPDLALAARLALFGAGGFTPQAGEIPSDFFVERVCVRFHLQKARSARWLDLRQSAPETAIALSTEMAALLPNLGYRARVTIGDFVGKDRALTQATARWAYEHNYRGIVYNSTHAPTTIECWAIFPGTRLEPDGEPEPIRRDDPDVKAVATLFGLIIP
ncbi:MAG: RES family NAD+ phosphorylase [Chloroflexota bacterium]|nr:RES family NAD+ phosphorylase [Chloroflexota bacterium]